MTEAAAQFITPVTMQALSNRPVYVSQWDGREPNNMAHINLSREADAILVAPASADFMAKLLHGRADDLAQPDVLGAVLWTKCRCCLAPAMNKEMWAHPATQRNMAQLQAKMARKCWAWAKATKPAARWAMAGCWSPMNCCTS